jgi:hypothetical protein
MAWPAHGGVAPPASCNPPAEAAAVGYNTCTFQMTGSTGDFNTTNIDMAVTNGAGFKLYIYGFFSNVQTAANVTAAGSSVTAGSSNNTFQATLASATKTVPSCASSCNWHGVAFGGGEEICYTGSYPLPGSPVGTLTNWIGMWADPLEHGLQGTVAGITQAQWLGQSAGYLHFTEDDILENFLGFYSSNVNEADQTTHDWWNTAGVGDQLFQTQATTIASLSNASHTYCSLHVLATGSAVGYLKYYIDGSLKETNSWHKYDWDVTATAPASASATAITVNTVNAAALGTFGSDIVSGYDVYDVTQSVDLGTFNGTWSANSLGTSVLAHSVATNDDIRLTPQPPPGTNGAGTCTAVWCMGALDRQHQVLIFGSIDTFKVNVTQIWVYQASAANNLSN